MSSSSWSRRLSPNELSYFLPGRADGTNDVYFTAEFFAPPSLITHERVSLAWTILRTRHPLLAARVKLDSSLLPPLPSMSSSTINTTKTPNPTPKSALDAYYRSAHFVLDQPESLTDALERTRASGSLDLHYLDPPSIEESPLHTQQEGISSATLVNDFINGPPFLSPERLVGLIITPSPMLADPALSFLDKLGALDSLPRFSDPASGEVGEEREQKYTALVCTAHCAISGLPVLRLIDEVFELLGGKRTEPHHQGALASESPRSTEELRALLEHELERARTRFEPSPGSSLVPGSPDKDNGEAGFLPSSLEDRIQTALQLPSVSDINEDVRKSLESDNARWIGSHTFPRKIPQHPQSPIPSPITRNNRFIDIVWPPELLPRILARCKDQERKGGGKVTVQNALFAACNVAWLRVDRRRRMRAANLNARESKQGGEERVEKDEEATQMLMYSAINVRPFLPPGEGSSLNNEKGNDRDREEDYAFLAIGYFNVMLPGSLNLPSSSKSPEERGDAHADDAEEAEFWARAKSTKLQAEEAVRHPDLLARTVLTCEERATRAIGFAIQDDGYLISESAEPPAPPPSSSSNNQTPKPRSAALLGLSLLGRLDTQLRTETYPSIRPTLLRTGARKAHGRGGVLLMSWSFAGVLVVSMCWDDEALEEGVIAEFVEEVREVMGRYVVGADDSGAGDMRGIDASH
ncbi:hypothetical protein DL93DRAFT_423821 [Clavulina sp. PMI_390]|nr:hypothetical protein DL93DRAFT_423821 [Clavulina sp. PMI_390]